MLEPGSAAPDFALSDDAGDTVRLSDLQGTRVVLYFYPKDDTPGCTTQACGIRDSWHAVQAAGVRLYGISPDSVADHVRFRARYGLPYPLLADTGHAVAEAYGVWRERTRAGRTSMGIDRSTFVVAEDGTLSAVLRSVDPETHIGQVLDALQEPSAAS